MNDLDLSILMMMFILFMALLVMTPAAKILKARLRNVPWYFDAHNRDIAVPTKRRGEILEFKIKGETLLIPYIPQSLTHTRYGPFALLYPEHAITVHPQAPKLAAELKKQRLKNYTVAELSLGLHIIDQQLKEQNKPALNLNATYTLPAEKEGQTPRKVTGMEYAKICLKEIGIYPWAITPRTVRDAFQALNPDIDQLENNISLMSNYLGFETRPAIFQAVVAAREEKALHENAFGKMKDKLTGFIPYAAIIIAIAIAAYLIIPALQSGGGINAVMGGLPDVRM